MSKANSRTQEGIGTETITGPHLGRNRRGDPDHDYYRCTSCGLESTDRRMAEHEWSRCGSGPQ